MWWGRGKKGCICHFVKWQIHPFISEGPNMCLSSVSYFHTYWLEKFPTGNILWVTGYLGNILFFKYFWALNLNFRMVISLYSCRKVWQLFNVVQFTKKSNNPYYSQAFLKFSTISQCSQFTKYILSSIWACPDKAKSNLRAVHNWIVVDDWIGLRKIFLLSLLITSTSLEPEKN